jgi:hypothetical protein
MAKTKHTSKHDLAIAQLLRLGGKIPAGLAAKAKAATESMLLNRLETGVDLQMQAAKLYGKLGRSIDVDDPANRKTLAAILKLHAKTASKKLAFPKAAPAYGGISTVFSGTVLPPYEFTNAMPYPFAPSEPVTLGNPIESATASANGQISASVVTSRTPGPDTSAGQEFAQVGFSYLAPGPGTLTLTATPTYSYEFLTNSLGQSPVTAVGYIELNIIPMSQQGQFPYANPQAQSLFFQGPLAQITFGAKFGVQASLSASLFLTPGVMYLCFAAVSAGALGSGWPGPNWPGYYGAQGSLALAMVSAIVPSISYSFAGEFAPRP